MISGAQRDPKHNSGDGKHVNGAAAFISRPSESLTSPQAEEMLSRMNDTCHSDEDSMRLAAFLSWEQQAAGTSDPTRWSLPEARYLAFMEVKRLKDKLAADNAYLQEAIELKYNVGDIIGQSPALQKVLRQVEQVATTPATVLLLGETGTGKELLARAIHNASPRRRRTMVMLNCAALPATLVESELFGREKGAARMVRRQSLASSQPRFNPGWPNWAFIANRKFTICRDNRDIS